MKLLKADHETLYEVSGVPGQVRKPVNLDGAALGFTRLRSLRLYQFQAGSVIDGHAEQDEVFVIVTAGSVEMKIGFSDEAVDGFGTFTLSAPEAGPDADRGFASSSTDPFVAYLPPHSVYRMTPHTDADVSYARATPTQTREPAVFQADVSGAADPIYTLLHDSTHAERLRLKILNVVPGNAEVSLPLLDQDERTCEVFVHLQGVPAARLGSVAQAGSPLIELASWDTVALSPGERPVLTVEQGSAVTVVAVLAC